MRQYRNQPRPIIIQQLTATIMRQYRNMSAVLIQTAFHSMANWCRCQNFAVHFFPNVINDQLALNLVDIYLDNTLQTLCKSLLCFTKFRRFAKSLKNRQNHLVAGKILNVQFRNRISCSVSDRFQQSWTQNLSWDMFYPKQKKFWTFNKRLFVLFLMKQWYFWGIPGIMEISN